MKTLNQTPFPFATLTGKVQFPQHSLTLMVKGTFDLAPDHAAKPSAKQLFPTGDEFHPGDDEGAGSPRYESDFAYLKQRADLLLAGKCHAPGVAMMEACPVTFRVGAKGQTLMVVGDRNWQGLLGRTVSPPKPFWEMPLRYEHSYGGEGYKKNPVGKGYGKEADESGKSFRPLPNIEDPAALIDSPGDRPAPAGFGPVSSKWAARQSKLGTYKAAWLKQRWPWYPEDFNWSYFNAAPEAMQAEGFLAGHEELYFENLHPKYAKYRATLPGLRVRCFLNEGQGTAVVNFREVKMNLDTLWVDMEAEKLVLVWRGVSNVLSEEFEELKHTFVVSEPVSQTPKSVEFYRVSFQKALEAEDAEFKPEKPVELKPPAPKDAAQNPVDGKAPAPEMSPEVAATQARLDPIFNRLKAESKLPPGKSQEEHARLVKDLEALGEGDFDAMMERTTAEMAVKLKASGIDLSNPPPLTEAAKQQLGRMLKEMGLGDVAQAEAAYLNGMAAIREAAASLGLVSPLPATPESVAVTAPPAATAPTAEETKARAKIEANVKARERMTRGESMAGADLSGLDFSGMELKGMDFSGAILAGTLFKNANVSEANFAGATGEKADFTGAKLKKAKLIGSDFTGACFNSADLTGALMAEAVFEKAAFEKALLDMAEAKGAVFSEANLNGASLQKAKLDETDFSRCQLHQANFTKASLKAASVQGAAGSRVNFTEADLTELRASQSCNFADGCFRQAVGPGSTWKKADLQRADFSHVKMESADFGSCVMDGANLFGADMKSARFTRASLRGAKLVEMNLFEGSLEKADLSGADLSGSNLYGVEFLEAKFAQTTARNTNVKMTKMDVGGMYHG